MATYLNDLRLTELATGEGSGTWGTTTNLSLELIGEALGFATQQVFGSDADATTTIADGASDPARAMYFKITSAGSLTATRTCTIAPNTISRVMFIENATTGSQSIQISQGSGASVTILAGKTAVVYLDGAGAGAAVVDAMAGVDPGVTDTLAEVLAAGNTSGANNLIIDNGQAITTNTINETTAASGVTIDSVLLKDDGVNATNLEITNLKANDGTSAGSIADSTGVVTLASSVLTTADINGGTIDGTTIGATTPASVAATTGTFSGDISVAGIGTIKQIDSNSVMIGAGAVNLRMIDVTSDIRPVDSAGLGVDGTVDLGDANARFKDLYLSGAVSSGTITTTGAATFGGTLSSGGITTTGNTAAGTASAGDGRLFPNNAYGAFVYGNGTTYDVALGQRSTGVALGVLAGTTNVVIPTGNVGIGAAAPESIVHIKDSGNVSTTLQIEGAATGYAPVINFDGIVAGNADYLLGEINGSWDTHTNVVSAIRFESGADTTNKDDGLISFWTSSSGPTLEERARLTSDGNFLVGTTSATGSGASSGKQLIQFNGAAENALYVDDTRTAAGTDTAIIFGRGATITGSITTTLTTTAYVTSSDQRLKSQFAPTTGALAKIVEAHDNQLIGEFHFLSDPDTTVWGYNAHALIDNQPGFGGTEGAGPRDMAIGEEYEPATFDEDGNEITPAKKVTPAGVDQSKRVPLLEAAIYDLLKMNEALTARLDAAGL
jgi:hypothetical protein